MNYKYSDTVLTIDLEAIRANYKVLDKKVGNGVECASVVKSNAYGLGIEQVMTALSSVGCRNFFVATLDEALQIRKFSLTDNIYVLNGVRQGQEMEFLQHNLVPVLNDGYQIEVWREFSRRKESKLPVTLHIDTGMSRFGISVDDARELYENREYLKALNITLVMSHLACADEPDHEMNKLQFEKFSQCKEFIGTTKLSLCNSAGIFLGSEYHFDMVRPGAYLYGLQVSPSIDPPPQPVVKITSRILQVREIKENVTVGYGATRQVKKGSVLATVALGYGDGISRALSNHGYVYILDTKCPIVGRVSMDSLVVEITDIPLQEVSIGTEVEIIGENISMDDIAKQAGTIGYEVLTSLDGRYKKQYIS
jgi:alanine racemase